MLIGVVNKDAENRLLSFIKDINAQAASAWGVVALERQALAARSDDTFVLSIKPALELASRATVYIGACSVYIVWLGAQKRTETALRALAPSLYIKDSAVGDTAFAYIDPVSQANELSQRLHAEASTVSSKPTMATEAHKMGLIETIDFSALALSLPEYKKLLEKKHEHRQLKILIIEDQSFLRRLLTESLQKTHAVFSAAGVREGLDIYLREAPHVVFLDIGLPDASGHMLAHKLREIDPTSYVIMVTGSRDRQDIEQAKQNGVFGFIVKPFSKQKIQEAIARYLAVRPLATEGEA